MMKSNSKHKIESELTAYCGLFCGDCIRYKSKGAKLAGELIAEFNSKNYSEYSKIKKENAAEFNHFESSLQLLTSISNFGCNIPCRAGGDGCGGNCKIIQCVREKLIAGCWECPVYENCPKLTFLKPFHGDGPLKNLKLIKKHGLENWENHREKCYTWE